MFDPTILVLIFGAIVLLWLMSSRTRKQQAKAAEFRDSLQPGQEVMTGSGLFGTVVEVQDDAVILEIAPGVTSRWLKPAILKAVEPPVDDDVDDEDYDDDDVEYDDEEYEDDDVEYEDDDEDYDDDDVDAEEPLQGERLDDESVEVPEDLASLTEDDDPRS